MTTVNHASLVYARVKSLYPLGDFTLDDLAYYFKLDKSFRAIKDSIKTQAEPSKEMIPINYNALKRIFLPLVPEKQT